MKAGGWHQNGGDISQKLHGFSAGRQSNLTWDWITNAKRVR
jgi:hypothetical protein